MTIKIVNPTPGGQKYTTIQRADSFVRRGIAILTDEGCLYFLPDSPAIRVERQRIQYEAHIAAGMTFWNGSVKDPYAMRRPGEVRS